MSIDTEWSMLWYIAVGSAVGGVGRFLIGGLVQRWSGTSLPAGTLAVNISGSFLLGLLLRYSLETPSFSPELRAALTIGVCGGYTTFSTFSYETVALLEEGEWSSAVLYLTLSLLGSLAGTFFGLAAARRIV